MLRLALEEKFMDQRDGIRLAPHILLHEFFHFADPRTVQDIVHVLVDAIEQFIDLLVSIRFIQGTLARQRLHILRLVFGKIILKNFCKIVHKMFRVQIVFEVFSQETFQRFKSPRLEQTRLQAAPPQHLPFQGHYVGYEHLFNNIDRFYDRADAREKLVVGRGVFALEQLWLTKQRPTRGQGGCCRLGFRIGFPIRTSTLLTTDTLPLAPNTESGRFATAE
jgi:hypothetical protein